MEDSKIVQLYWDRNTDSIAEIAVQYQMKENAVSMALNRIRVQLHNYLIERGFEL